MQSTQQYTLRADGKSVFTCESELGSYSLAYSTIPVKIFQFYQKDRNEPIGSASIYIGDANHHPDRNHRFCLDFLDNGFSEDDIKVVMSANAKLTAGTEPIGAQQPSNSSNDLLSLLISKNIDKSGVVIQNLLRALFIGITKDPNLTVREVGEKETDARLKYEDEFDPFDLHALAALNQRIYSYGFCVTMGKYTHDDSVLSANSYCDNPKLSLKAKFRSPYTNLKEDQTYLVDREKIPSALYYRPRRSYPMYVYVRDDPDLEEAWELRKIQSIKVENISPIIGLGVNRVLFAENRVVLAFDRGELLETCIARTSTAKAAVEIPLDIIYGVVSLPAQAIRQKVLLKGKRFELLNKQRNVLEAQDAYLKAQAEQASTIKSITSQKALDKSTTNHGGSSSNKAVSVFVDNNKDIAPAFCEKLENF